MDSRASTLRWRGLVLGPSTMRLRHMAFYSYALVIDRFDG
jgi:hypothetical protein